MSTVTDLRNTTWEIASGWTATAGYGQFSINGVISGNDFTHFHIGYRLDTESDSLTPTANTIAEMYNGALIGNLVSLNKFTVKFTDGEDATNTQLISWVETYGTLATQDTALIIKQSTLEAIGDAIRNRKGTTALIPVPNLASEILSIVKPTGKLTITDTAVKDVTNYAQAQVVDGNLVAGNIRKDVSILGVTGTLEEGITPSGTRNITSNGSYDVTNYANVNVQVEDIPAVVGEKTVTEPGVYDAVDDDLEGYSVVNVAIPTYLGELTNALYIRSDGESGGAIPEGLVTAKYWIYEDNPYVNGTKENYKPGDKFLTYGYEENYDGEIVPCLYKSDPTNNDNPGPDYAEPFFYVGTYDYDGVTYDRWRKIEGGDISWTSDATIYILTRRIVDRVISATTSDTSTTSVAGNAVAGNAIVNN